MEAPLWDAESVMFSLHPSRPVVIRAETPHTVYARVAGFDRRWWAVNLKSAILAERVATGRATLVAAISRAIAEIVRTDYGVPESKTRIGYLGIPLVMHPMPPRRAVQTWFSFSLAAWSHARGCSTCWRQFHVLWRSFLVRVFLSPVGIRVFP